MTVFLWRNCRLFPEILRGPLAVGTRMVSGDGIGVVRGVRSRHHAFRLIIATDCCLLLSSSTCSPNGFPLVDAPYSAL